MSAVPADGSSKGSGSPASTQGSIRDAIRFWELHRVWYNFALAGLCLLWVIRTWPTFRPAVVAPHLPELLVLVLLANLCYSAAYFVEAAFHASPAYGSWRRRRWGLWLAGTLFALLIAQYWIGDEIYPSVR